MDYLTALRHFHRLLNPRHYVEIGCRHGISLTLAQCPSIAVDPDFEITRSLSAPTRIFRQTSDAFFAQHDLSNLLGGTVDLAFIDGMHKAEFVLRDFLNLERHSSSNSVIIIDDVLPQDIRWTTRERQTQAWTGDVYKIIPFLRKHRPDLKISVFDIEMKGLAVIHNLDPANRDLQKNLGEHEETLIGSAFELETVENLRNVLEPQPTENLLPYIATLETSRGAARASSYSLGNDSYLDLLKRSLLNEVYLDDELRIQYLRACLDGKEQYRYDILHDIRSARSDDLESLKLSRQVGRFPDRTIQKSGFSHTMMGRLRLDSLHECLNHIHAQNIPGDLVECGVWRGGGCIFMAGWAKTHDIDDRKIIVADSFEGLPVPSVQQDLSLDLSKEKFPQLAVSEDTVRDNFAVYGLLDHKVHFLKGWFKDTLTRAPTNQIALLRLDGDLYESTMDALNALYDKVSPGGVVIIDDYGALKVCRDALDDFFSARNARVPQLHKIDWTGVYFIKPITTS